MFRAIDPQSAIVIFAALVLVSMIVGSFVVLVDARDRS
jgi:hypothetical protein